MSSSNQKPNTKKRVVYAVLLAIPLCYNLFHLCFIGFQNEKLHAVSGVLVGMPRYHSKDKGYDEWFFRLRGNKQVYCIRANNPCRLDHSAVWKMQTGDSVIVYTYDDRSLSRLLDYFQNHRTVMGMKCETENYLYPNIIAQDIRLNNIGALIWWLFILLLFSFFWFYYLPRKER